MTEEQYILTKIMEECGEVIQVCAKAQRFGLDNIRPGSEVTNLDKILDEFQDLRVAMNKLRHYAKFDYPLDDSFDIKSKKFDEYYAMSKNMGFVIK